MGGIWLAGCSAAEQPVTALQVLNQCDAFKGKSVQVGGYLGNCAGYDCQLFTGKPGSDRFFGVLLDGPVDQARSEIGVGFDEAFDRKAAPLQHSYVVITGRIDEHSCDGRGGTDRSAGIHPKDIRASTADEASPAKLVAE